MLRKVGGAIILGVLFLVLPAEHVAAAVQTLVDSGVDSLVDNVPTYGDSTLLWTTLANCTPDGVEHNGVPGDETSPALISRASVEIADPRPIFSFNPTRPVAVCNPYRLLSNIFPYGEYLYFIDNQGSDGQAALRRVRRDAEPIDPSPPLADLGPINGGRLIVSGNSIFAIIGDNDYDRIVEYTRDTGILVDPFIDLPSNPGTLGRLQFDGRFLYWTRSGALRRKDRRSNMVETVVPSPIQSLYVYGYDEGCDPDGCWEYSRIVYGQNGRLYEAETISGSIFPLYTSPVTNAVITFIERDATHYYFIERRPLAVFSSEERIYRLGVSDTIPDLIYGPVDSTFGGLEGLRTDFIWLYFRNRTNRSLQRIATFEAEIPVFDLRARGLEITQGLQNTANALRLIEDKRTIVRFYVRSETLDDVRGVTASLSGYNGNLFLGTLQPVNASGKLITVRSSPSRTNLDHSFQFDLPRNWTTGGKLTLTATVNPARRIIEDVTGNNSITREVTFTPSPRLLVIYYEWGYDLGGAKRVPSRTDLAASRRLMRRLYPLGEPGSAFESPGLHTVVLDFDDNELTDQVDRTDADCIKRYPKKADRNMCASDYVHARMRALRKGSGIAADTISYGDIAQAPAPKGLDYFTRGYAIGEYASGPATVADYASHEVGHTLGRDHPFRANLLCGHGGTLDPNYPYGGANIAATGPDGQTRFAGLDFDEKLPGAISYLDADDHYDVMSYCKPSWISDYTFEGMYQYLISDSRPRSAAGGRAAVAGDWLSVSGTMLPNENSGGFVHVERMETVNDATPPTPGDFTLELRDADGVVLASQPFAGEAVDELPGKIVFDFVVEFAPGTAELRVVDGSNGNVLATHAVSGNAPTISNLQVPPGPFGDVVNLSWTAADPDGDELRFDIYSIRQVDSFPRPLKLGVRGTQIALDTAAIPGGTNKLRVVASDGTNTAFVESAPFNMTAHKPQIVITSPVNGFHADWHQVVTLQAEVDDVQDGEILDVRWSSNRSGMLGSGRTLQTDQLAVGEHIIEASARNVFGQDGTATVTVVVGDVLAAPGPALSVAPQAIAWHVAGDDDGEQFATLAVGNRGGGTLELDVSSDAPWLRIDGAASVSEATAPRMLAISAAAVSIPTGTSAYATLTLENRNDPNDVVVVPVELSRGNVFDETGAQAAVVPCPGDCDDGGSIDVEELRSLVDIALGETTLSACTNIDTSADGVVTIDELIRAAVLHVESCPL